MNEPSQRKRVVWAELTVDQSALELHALMTQLRTKACEHVEMAHRLKWIVGPTTSFASDILRVFPAFDNKDKTMAHRDAKIHSSREKIVVNITNRPLLVCSKGPNKSPRIGGIGRVNIMVNGSMGSPQGPTPRQQGLAPQASQSDAARGRSLQRQTAVADLSTVARSPTPQRQITIRPQSSVARIPSPQREPAMQSIAPSRPLLVQSDPAVGHATVAHQSAVAHSPTPQQLIHQSPAIIAPAASPQRQHTIRSAVPSAPLVVPPPAPRRHSPQRQTTIRSVAGPPFDVPPPAPRSHSPQRQPTIRSVAAGPPFGVPPPAPRSNSPQRQMMILHQSSVAQPSTPRRQPTIRSVVQGPPFVVPPPAPRPQSPQRQMTIRHQSPVAFTPTPQPQPTVQSIVPSAVFLEHASDSGRLGPPAPLRKQRVHRQRAQQRQLVLWQGIADENGMAPPIVCAMVNVSPRPWRPLPQTLEEEAAAPITYVPARILTLKTTGPNAEYERYAGLLNPKVAQPVVVGVKRRRECGDQGGDEQPPTNRRRPLERSSAVANLAMDEGTSMDEGA